MQFTTLQKDMMQAMKDHDKVKKDALSTLVSATKKLAIDAGCRDDIPDEMTDQAILKEIKRVKEQIDRKHRLSRFKFQTIPVYHNSLPMAVEDGTEYSAGPFADRSRAESLRMALHATGVEDVYIIEN